MLRRGVHPGGMGRQPSPAGYGPSAAGHDTARGYVPHRPQHHHPEPYVPQQHQLDEAEVRACLEVGRQGWGWDRQGASGACAWNSLQGMERRACGLQGRNSAPLVYCVDVPVLSHPSFLPAFGALTLPSKPPSSRWLPRVGPSSLPATASASHRLPATPQQAGYVPPFPEPHPSPSGQFPTRGQDWESRSQISMVADCVSLSHSGMDLGEPPKMVTVGLSQATSAGGRKRRCVRSVCGGLGAKQYRTNVPSCDGCASDPRLVS